MEQFEEHVPKTLSKEESALLLPKASSPQEFGNVIDKINTVQYTVDQITNLPFQLIAGYDDRGISTALAGFIVKANWGSDAVTTDHLSEELMILVLGIRVALSICNAVAETTEEDRRYQRESRKRKKLQDRYLEMVNDYQRLFEEAKEAIKNKTEPNWPDYNARIFSDIIDIYSTYSGLISEEEEHLFYSVLRRAIPAEKKDLVFKKLRQFKKANTLENRNEFVQVVKEALNARVKPPSIIKNKLLRRLLRYGKRFLDFIMANATGLSVVTIFATYLAIVPFLSIMMLPVYIVAIGVGVLFGVLRVARDVIEHKHQKIATKALEEKSRYRQSQAMKKLLSFIKKIILRKKADDEYHPTENSAEMNSNKQEQEEEVSKKPTNAWRDFLLRLLVALPLPIIVGSISGWWCLITLSGVVAGLGGSAILVGTAIVVAPAIIAGIMAIYFGVRVFVQLYRDYHLEKEDIKELEKEAQIQNEQKKSNPVLKKVCDLSDAELLKNYIKEYLDQEDKELQRENSKEFFQNIQKMVGFKLSEAIDPNAFYGYLASRVLVGPIHSEAAKTQALSLVTRLKATMESFEPKSEGESISIEKSDSELRITTEVMKKPNSKSEKFREGLNIFFTAITPIIIGIGVAIAFASGPAFPFVALGVCCLLVITTILNEVMKRYYENRKNERELLRARMTVCDETALLFLRSGHDLPNSKERPKDQPEESQSKSPVQEKKLGTSTSISFFAADPLKPTVAVSIQSSDYIPVAYE